jgi:glycosyl transferase family 25
MGGLYGDRGADLKGRAPLRTHEHLAERGVDARFFYGIHGSRLGLRTTLPYERDHPGTGFIIGPSVVGCWLSHRALWSALMLSDDDATIVIEDDAVFPEDWRARLEQALSDVPEDWDMLYIGSCCADDKPRTHVRGVIHEVRFPLCTHGYVVRRKALETLIRTTDEARCYAPIDVSLFDHSLPHLRCYTMLPRLLEQHGTVLPP